MRSKEQTLTGTLTPASDLYGLFQPKQLADNRFPKREPKYARGANPCGLCDARNHGRCRPKLDGTLCTCECPQAIGLREEVILHRELAVERGDPEPTVAECIAALRPRWKQLFASD